MLKVEDGEISVEGMGKDLLVELTLLILDITDHLHEDLDVTKREFVEKICAVALENIEEGK